MPCHRVRIKFVEADDVFAWTPPNRVFAHGTRFCTRDYLFSRSACYLKTTRASKCKTRYC